MILVEIEKQLKDFCLQVSFSTEAHTTGLLGASGSGKSMTLRCIAGIETPDRGRIVVDGKVLFDSERKINLSPQQRNVGYLFQHYALFPHMTVRQNISMGYRGERAGCEGAVRSQIQTFRLEGLEERYPSQLSGGQQQRVALARMLVGEPMMILLDEPFSALDGYLKDILRREMQKMLESYPGPMLMVSHSRDEVYQMCEQLCLMQQGHSFLCGETREVFRSPRYLEGARLTGCKNFSRARKADPYHVEALDWGITLRTAEEVEEEIAWIAIRGHWLTQAEEKGENVMEVSLVQEIETPFEYQYVLRNRREKEGGEFWWMQPKKTPGEADRPFPERLYFPPEHLMLLR